MHRSSVLVVVLTSAFVAVAASGPRDRELAHQRHRAAEVVRLRAHFDSVDAELRARDVSSLGASQRASRTRLIAWLRDYRDAGRFPENDRIPAPAPFFRDVNGTLCAMAYLIDRSGRSDIVGDVARSRNNAYIRELVDDPRLVAWLDSVGLSAEEAARIQPTYGWKEGVTEPREVSDGDALAAGLLIGSSVLTSAVNIAAPTRNRGILGAAIGTGTLVFGLVKSDGGPNYRNLARITTVAGGLAIITGARAIALGSRPVVVHRAAPLTLSPALLDGGGRRRPGVVASARF